MKRVLLLLLIVASAVTVSAQKQYRNDRDERYHYKYDNRKEIRGNFDRRDYKRQVMNINRQFDAKVRSVKKNPFMSRNQKNRKIHELEMHRRMALKEYRKHLNHNRKRDYARERRFDTHRR